MAIFEYKCNQDGLISIHCHIGTAPKFIVCSLCGSEATRVLSVPMITGKAPKGYGEAIALAEKSRFEPEVVSSIPSRNKPRYSPKVLQNSTLRNLPKP